MMTRFQVFDCPRGNAGPTAMIGTRIQFFPKLKGKGSMKNIGKPGNVTGPIRARALKCRALSNLKWT